MKNTQVFVGIFLFLAVFVFALTGCGSSGSSDSAWWGGGDSGGGGTPVTTPQVQTLTNLNNPGQPIRQGDWTQINGAGFGATQGAGYVKYTLENGATGNADQYSAWSDTQITCRVPVATTMDIAVKGTWGAQVFTDNGGSSNELPTAGNPTPNPTPTNSPPPTASPSPTPSVSPSASPTPSVSPTPSPSPTSGGGGGGGGGGGATAQWWNLGFAEMNGDASNIQVGGDVDGNVYVSCEYEDIVYVFEGDVGAKGFRTQNTTFNYVRNFPGYDHSLFVPSNESKTFGVAYRNSTSLVIQKAVKSGSTWGFGNCTALNGSTPSGLNSPKLYMSGNSAYTSHGYSSAGSHYVGVNSFTIPSAGTSTYTNWATPNMGSITGKNATISSGTKLNVGYITNDNATYRIGSWQGGSTWVNYQSSVGSPGVNTKTTTNGTTAYALIYSTSLGLPGLNLWNYDSTYLPVGTPGLNSNENYNHYYFGQPIVANGKKTVAVSSNTNLYVVQNSNCSGPWTQIGQFVITDSQQFGAGSTVNGAPLISYMTQQYAGGPYGIRTQAYSTTTPRAIAQREFIRATFLCSYVGMALPLPRL